MKNINSAQHNPLPNSSGQVELPLGQMDLDKVFLLNHILSVLKNFKFWKLGKWKFPDTSGPGKMEYIELILSLLQEKATILTHCGLVMPFGFWDLGQFWFRW